MSTGLSIQAALSAVMAELPAIGKERHQGDRGDNERGVQYAYRGIEQVTRECQGLFAKHGVVIVPHVESIEVKDITVNNKPWTDTRLVVTYTLTGPDGSTLTARTVGIGRDNSDKGANKAMTQAFKYLLLQVLCISDAKDDGDGSTFEADAAPRVHPNDGRMRAVVAELTSIRSDEAGKADWEAFRGTRKVTEKTLIDDPALLEDVENWLALREHDRQMETAS